jgi:predicted MFS family arabinose efflux permease
MIAFRATSRAVLFAPYLYHFITSTRGLSTLEFGFLQSIYYFVAVSLEVPSGVMADRFGRKHTLVLGALLTVAGSLLRIVAFDFWVFAVAEVLFATALALVSGADSAILYDSLDADGRADEYARYEGLVQSSWLAVTAVGFPLTDYFLVRGDDPTLAFAATAALASIGVVCALAMQEPPRNQRLGVREITSGALRDVIRVPGILRLLAYSAGVFVLLRAAIILFFNPTLADKGVPVAFYGTALALVNVVGALVAWRAHRIMAAWGDSMFLFAMPASLLAMYALLIPANAPVAISLFCVQGAAIGAYPIAVRTMLNRLVPSAEKRATTLSIESLACRLCYGVVVILFAWLLDALSLYQALPLVALLGCVPFALMWLLPRAIPKQPS